MFADDPAQMKRSRAAAALGAVGVHLAIATVGATSSVACLLGQIAPTKHKHPTSGFRIPLVGRAKHQRVREAGNSGSSSQPRPLMTSSLSTIAALSDVPIRATVEDEGEEEEVPSLERRRHPTLAEGVVEEFGGPMEENH